MADKLTETVGPDALSSALEKIRAARDSRAVVALRGDEAKAVYEAAERADELQRSFELRWKADMRAIERWRAAKPGNDLVMPDHADLVVWLIEALTPAGEDEAGRLREALTPTGDTKAAYMGEFSWTEWLPDESGTEQGHERVVPWTTIKEIMAAIRERAGVDRLDEADAIAALSRPNVDEGVTQADWEAAEKILLHLNRKNVLNTPEEAEMIRNIFRAHRVAALNGSGNHG